MSINTFSVSTKVNGLETRVEVSGYVSEAANFSSIKTTPVMKISLRNVSGLNSIGTRTWCQWLNSLSGCSEVWIEAAPVLFVKAFNQVMGSLTPNCIIQSFYVPYFSEATGESQEVLYSLGTDYNLKGEFKSKEILDSKGKAMEVDVVLEWYLVFLKNREKSI